MAAPDMGAALAFNTPERLPSDLSVTLGSSPRELNASAPPITGATIYNWRGTTAAQPGVVVQTAQTTAASNTFANLTPGMVYNCLLYTSPSPRDRQKSRM